MTTPPKDLAQTVAELTQAIEEKRTSEQNTARTIREMGVAHDTNMRYIRDRLGHLEPAKTRMSGGDRALLIGILGCVFLVVLGIVGLTIIVSNGDRAREQQIGECIAKGQDPVACRTAMTGNIPIDYNKDR